MDRARLPLMAMILVGITSCAGLIVNSNHERPDDRRELFDFETCPVHGDPLVEGVVRMVDRRASEHPWAWEVRKKLFPCWFEDTNDSRDQAVLIRYCPHCRLANELYLNTEVEQSYIDLANVDEFVAQQRAELQERHPETQFVDAVETADSGTALETDTPEWVE